MTTKWNRKLGTTKREQGIETPKAPQNRKKTYNTTRDSIYDRVGRFFHNVLDFCTGRYKKKATEESKADVRKDNKQMKENKTSGPNATKKQFGYSRRRV